MSKFHRVDDNHIVFACPGCGSNHMIPVVGEHKWDWNGSLDNPTLHPSILARSGHYAPHFQSDSSCWCSYNASHPADPIAFECSICHSFVMEGNINFCTDSTHKLSGQMVEIPDWEA
jgi:hypothetical protein